MLAGLALAKLDAAMFESIIGPCRNLVLVGLNSGKFGQSDCDVDVSLESNRKPSLKFRKGTPGRTGFSPYVPWLRVLA